MPGSGPRPTPVGRSGTTRPCSSDPFFVRVLFDTVAASCLVRILTAVVGFPIAYSLARSGERMRRLKLIILILPLSLSLVVNVFGWMVILGRNGLVNAPGGQHRADRPAAQLLFNWGAVIVVLTHTFLPFQVLSIMGVIVQIDTGAGAGGCQSARQPLDDLPPRRHSARHAGRRGGLHDRVHAHHIGVRHAAHDRRDARADARQPDLRADAGGPRLVVRRRHVDRAADSCHRRAGAGQPAGEAQHVPIRSAEPVRV